MTTKRTHGERFSPINSKVWDSTLPYGGGWVEADRLTPLTAARPAAPNHAQGAPPAAAARDITGDEAIALLRASYAQTAEGRAQLRASDDAAIATLQRQLAQLQAQQGTPAGAAPVATSAQRRRELLRLTPLGRQVLAEEGARHAR